MSIDRNIYVGPIVVCTTAVGTVDEPRGTRCATHGETDDAAFCPRCGVATEPVTERLRRAKVEIPEGIFDDLMDVQEDDWPLGEQVYVPNIGGKYSPRPFHLDDIYSYRGFLGPDTQDEDKKWLRGKYRAAIDKLKTLYGASNVRIEWAILRWSS